MSQNPTTYSQGYGPFAAEQETYTFDRCPHCESRTFVRRLRVYKCRVCWSFFCSACMSSWSHSCPHCGARRSGMYVGRA